MKKVWYIGMIVAFCCSCSHVDMEEDPSGQEVTDEGKGRIALMLTNDGAATRVAEADVDTDTFLVTIYKGADRVTEAVRLTAVKDLKLDAGYGYSLQAENCTATDAEASNGGWGQKHFYGRSGSFVIMAGETTTVKVACSVANAGLSVDFSSDFLNLYPNCIVKVKGDRGIAWPATEEDGMTPRVAYFNADEDVCEVTILVYLDGEEDSTPMERVVALEKKTVYKLKLKPSSKGGLFSISITYDSDFEEVGGSEVELE